MNSLWIAGNIMKRSMQSKKKLALYLLLPCIIISLIVGLIGDGDTTEVVVHYVNEDQGAIGEQIVNLLEHKSGYVLRELETGQELRDRIIDRAADDGFVIPADYSERLLAGEPVPIPAYYLTMTESSALLRVNLEQIAGQAWQAAQLSIERTSGDAERAEASAVGLLAGLAQHHVRAEVTDPDLYVSSVLYLATGMILMFVMYFMNHTITGVIEDRQNRTLARVYAAPVRSVEIMTGYFLGSWAAGTLQIVFVILVTRYVVGFEYGLGFWEQLLMLECFLLAVLGLASIIAGLTRNPHQSGMIAMFVITPTCMIGGCWWPIEVMPEFMQKIANFTPQKWAIDGISLMATGKQIPDIGLHFLILGLAGIVLLGFGSAFLRPQETELV